jgi:D-arabinitol dehydrogenase (NADP+)
MKAKKATTRMKAAVINGPHDLEIKDLPVPIPKEGEAIVETLACGICGTDLHILAGEFPVQYPLVPGHEIVGMVEEVGARVSTVEPGDLVVADPAIVCNKCHFCVQNKQNLCEQWNTLGGTMPGGYAEFVAVPEGNLLRVSLPDPRLGTLVEPLACVICGHQKVELRVGESVLVIGAGPIGLLHLQVSLKAGASAVDVVDLHADRLEIAKSLGARNTTSGDAPKLNEALRAIEPRGYDLVIDATGVPEVVENAIRWVKNGGKMLIFGVCPEGHRIRLDPFEIYRRDLSIVGSFSIRKTFLSAVRMIEGGQIDLAPLLGESFPLSDLPRAFDMMASGRSSKKLVVTPR